MHSLPIFMRLEGRPVVLVGEGDEAAAKRRLLLRAGAAIVPEDSPDARLAVVVDDDAAANRLRARGVLVNATDRPELCDWTLPAIIDRDPVLVAVGSGGVSAGLAAALRQRLEALLPTRLGALATALQRARTKLRERWPEPAERRRQLGRALAERGPLDPLGTDPDVDEWLAHPAGSTSETVTIHPRSADPDDLTLREARALALADCIYHAADAPPAVLARARADAPRRPLPTPAPADAEPGLTVIVHAA